VENVNRTLEARIAAREQELDASYRSLAALQRVQAAADERALIVRDLHDGLGSALFASLARIEGGRMEALEVAQMLRECIAEMRLVFEAMPPEERDFSSVLGSFRFRWHQLLQTQGIESEWLVDLPIGAVRLTPQGALQVLRVLQEALTNVLKHARATRICVSVSRGEGGGWCVQVEDNGIGLNGGDVAMAGRGMGNMQRRAQRLGASLSVRPAASGGTCVVLQLPADEAGVA
jgi:signal transduction histidine kinase